MGVALVFAVIVFVPPLRRATAKFDRRFRAVEALARERGIGRDLDALEALWQEVKGLEQKIDHEDTKDTVKE